MKTNKFLFFILLGLSTLLMQSCLKDQNDIFDKSSSLRMQEALDNAKKTLTSSAEGWIFDYYPDRNLSYGGYVYTVKFGEDDKATVESEIADKEETSYYRLTNDDGPVLAFDTYNSLMHAFATPSASAYEANDGDFEFVIMDVKSDIITLRGKRSGNTMYLRKLNKPAHDYIKEVKSVASKMNAKAYGIDIDGKTYSVKRSLQVLTITTDEDVYELPFIVTPAGFQLYEPVEVAGKTIKGFAFDESGRWSAIDEPSVVLYGIYPSLAEQLITSPWFFAASKMSPKVLQYFEMAKAGSASEGETIGAMLLGPASGVKLIQSSRNYTDSFAFAFTSGNYAGALLYNWTIIDDHTVKIGYSQKYEGDGDYYYSRCNYNYIVAIIGASAGKTYKLTADDDKIPTWIKMEQVEDPTVYWTLSADVIRDPLNK